MERVFDLLDDWRCLPDYQLERRADIFFAVYLPEFLADHLRLNSKLSLIPEFPIRNGTIDPLTPNNQSCKVDYLAITADGSRAFLIELKTDESSWREKQGINLQAAKEIGLAALLDGLLKIARSTQQRQKYWHLLRMLSTHSLLNVPGQLDHEAKQFRDQVASCRVVQPCPSLEVIYVLPRERPSRETGFTAVTFKQFADWLKDRNEPLAARFARSLQHWSTTIPGGSDTPAIPASCD